MFSGGNGLGVWAKRQHNMIVLLLVSSFAYNIQDIPYNHRILADLPCARLELSTESTFITETKQWISKNKKKSIESFSLILFFYLSHHYAKSERENGTFEPHRILCSLIN